MIRYQSLSLAGYFCRKLINYSKTLSLLARSDRYKCRYVSVCVKIGLANYEYLAN